VQVWWQQTPQLAPLHAAPVVAEMQTPSAPAVVAHSALAEQVWPGAFL